jgi:hypothetical protein
MFFCSTTSSGREIYGQSDGSLYGALGKYFQMRCINERDHYCECGQLETVEHVLKECPLHSAERDYLRKVSPELDSKILLDTKVSIYWVLCIAGFP